MIAYALVLMLQATHHANYTFNISYLRFFFMDNHAHKLHHCPRGYLVNHGALFSVWDQVFGTYYENWELSSNHTRGHQCGDYVLKELSELMSSIISRPTDVIARYGGEEFAILLHNTTKEGAEHVASELVTQASTLNLAWEGIPFTVTISIGAHSVVANKSMTLDSLISAADGALYNAKQNGRNQWVIVS